MGLTHVYTREKMLGSLYHYIAVKGDIATIDG
jgi:hypothetical protein